MSVCKSVCDANYCLALLTILSCYSSSRLPITHLSYIVCKIVSPILTREDPAPLRSRAIRRLVGLRMCKHKLEQTTFCTCHNLNPSTLSSSKLLPSKQRSTIFFCLWLCKRKLEQIPFCTCHNPQSKDTFIFTAATHKQRMCLHASRSRIAQTVFCTVHVQCTHSARYSACHTVHGHKTL